MTIILAPDGGSSGVREVLTDWSSVGLVDQFLWVEPAMSSAGAVHAISIEAGRQHAVRLDQLAGVRRVDLIRFAVLVPAVAGEVPASTGVVQEIADLLERTFGGSSLSRVRVIVTRVGDPTRVDDLALDGWHNIMLSPEDSTAPGVGAAPLRATNDSVEISRHAAVGLAGLLGLWTDCPSGPLDDEPVLPGRLVRLSRSYYRRLATDDVERALRREVLTMEAGFPLPQHAGTSTVFVEDSGLAARTMADQLWVRHNNLLRGPRERIAAISPGLLGAGEALTMFFRFLGSALINAPKALASAVVIKVKAETASAVHGLVFGRDPSAYSVVVGGVTLDGTPVSWLQMTAAAGTLDRVLEEAGERREHEQDADLSALWEDYASGALTLADAEPRVAGMLPVQIGPQRGVLRRPEMIVPSSSDSFRDVPAQIMSQVGGIPISPVDVLGMNDTTFTLQRLGQQAATGQVAAQTLRSFEVWKSHHSETYAVLVGQRLAAHLQGCLGEVRELLDQARIAANPDEALLAVQAKQQRLARSMRIVSVVFALAIALVVVLKVNDVISSGRTAGVIIFLVMTWLGVACVMFMRGQQDLFHLITSRRQILDQEDVRRRNLRGALRDVRRLSQMYAQFLSWSQILSEVLSHPFGRAPASSDGGRAVLDGLPLSVGLGTAQCTASEVSAAAIALRRDILTVGWLGRPWTTAVAMAPRQIGPSASDLADDPRKLFGERADGHDSRLAAWAEVVGRSGVDHVIGDQEWAQVLGVVAAGGRGVKERLLATIVDDARPGELAMTHADFIGTLSSVRNPGIDVLNDAVLTDGARVRGASKVMLSKLSVEPRGLGDVICLTQLSDGIPWYDFIARRGDDAPIGTTSHIAEEPGDRTSEIFGGQPF